MSARRVNRRAAVATAAVLAAAGAGAGVAAHAAGGSKSGAGPARTHVVVQRRTFGSGGWSWFADPRAVHANGTTYAGWIDLDRYVVIAAIRGGSVERVRIARQSVLDDHGNPALQVRPDGRITAYYSEHNGSRMHARTTRHAGDIGSWGPEHSLPDNIAGSQGYTYPNPVRLGDEDRSYIFARGPNWGAVYWRTSASGWTGARRILSEPGQRPYLKAAGNEKDEIYLAFTNGHPRETVTDIYFAIYRNGALYKANGKRIEGEGSFPIRPSQAGRVYGARAHGRRAWIHDVAVGPDGDPVLVFATFRKGEISHRYHYARYVGDHWNVHSITSAGGPITNSPKEPQYSGGVVLDHRDPRIVYASVQSGSYHEIGRYVTEDRGKTWRRKWITRDSGTENVRPVVPRDLPEGRRSVLWMRGRYVFYTDFSTTIVGSGKRR